MTPSDELFELIKSMTQTEKRYFKVFASRHVLGEQNNYEKLFDATEKQKVYDEARLKKQFEKASFINRFAVAKNYLYHLVLKSLDAYNADNTIDRKIRKQFSYAEILFEKGLYKQCGKIIASAKEMAGEYESHVRIFDILNLEIDLMVVQSYEGKAKEDMENIFKETFTAIDRFKNEREYKLLTSRIFVRARKQGFARDRSEVNAYDKILKHPLFRSDKKAWPT